MKAITINPAMLDKLVDATAAKVADAIMDAMTVRASGERAEPEPEPEPIPATGKPTVRTRRAARPNGSRTHYRLTGRTGKAGAKHADTLAPRLQPAYRALAAAGAAGLSIPDLQRITKRTSKQLENDVHRLKTDKLAVVV